MDSKTMKAKSPKALKRQRRRQAKTAAKQTQPQQTKKTVKNVKPKGVDPRRQSLLPFVANQQPAGTSSVVNSIQYFNRDNLIEFAVGYVQRLVEIGYSTPNADFQPQLGYPWYLTQYIVNQALICCRAEKLEVSSIPYGLLMFFDSLKPKRVPYKTGMISFTWDSGTIAPLVVPWQFVGSDYLVDMGVIADPTADSNGYPTTAQPAAYTDELGSAAWDAMITFLSQPGKPPMLQIVDSSSVKTITLNDVSAFSTVYPQLGSSSYAKGYTTQLFNPCKIRSPILSLFAYYDQDSIVTAESHIFAGGPRYLANRVLTMVTPSKIHNKVRPTFLPVDFDDIYDSLAYMIGKAAEFATSSPVNTVVTTTCPLTGPKVALMLRGLIAGLNNKTMGSDLAIADNGFRPLQFPYAGTNVSTVTKTCQLPFVFVENIRSLQPVAITPKDEKYSDQVFAWIPVYGTYRENKRSDWNFYYGPSNTPLYALETGNFDIVNLNIDNTNTVMALTGDALATAVQIWNEWVGQFKANIDMSTFSSSVNNPALYSILYHRGFQYNPPPPPQPDLPRAIRTASKEYKPIFSYKQLLKVSKSVVGTTDASAERYIASNLQIGNVEYELMSQWVLPRVYTNSEQLTNNYCGNLVMPYRIDASYSLDGNTQNNSAVYPLLTSKWDALATMAAYPSTGHPSEIVRVLIEATKKGEGGFFGSILADFAASVTGISSLSSLGSIIPF